MTGLCDYQHDLGNDAVMQPWIKEFYARLKNYFPNIQTDNLKTNFIPRWKVSLLKNEDNTKENNINSQEKLIEDIYFRDESKTDFMEANLIEVETNVRTTDEYHFQVSLQNIKLDILYYINKQEMVQSNCSNISYYTFKLT